jgi:hypothetical protein
MLIKCSNAACEAPFDYRKGRLIRFSSKPADGKPSENHTLIQHFWLCGKCSELYEFECESGTGVKIKLRAQKVSEIDLSSFVSAA